MGARLGSPTWTDAPSSRARYLPPGRRAWSRRSTIDGLDDHPGPGSHPATATSAEVVGGGVGAAGRCRRRTRLLGALAFALAVGLPLLRQRGAPSWNTIWGEDGWVYYQQAHDHGLSVLLRGYAGYLQLTPRLLAVPTIVVPVADLARYFAVMGVLVGALLAWFVYWATEGWIDARAVRLALAGLVVLAPALGYENTANVTNTIWILLAVAPWALVARSESRRAVLLRSLVVFASATATALSALFLPMALGYACLRRRRPTWVVVGFLRCRPGAAVRGGPAHPRHPTAPHRPAGLGSPADRRGQGLRPVPAR